MNVEEYMFKWIEIQEELEAHPDIQVLNWAWNTSTYTLEELQEKEKQASLSLPNTVKEFYTLADGLQLKWIHKQHPQFKEEEQEFMGTSFPQGEFSRDEVYSGCINILPFDLLLTTNWKDISTDWRQSSESLKEMVINGQKTTKAELFTKLFPFDHYGNGATAAFYVSEADFGVMLSTQYFTDFSSYPLIDFETYLKLIQLDYGLFRKRAFRFDKLRYIPLNENDSLNIDSYASIDNFEYYFS